MAKRYVVCRECGFRNDRIGGRRKCASCQAAFPKRRVPRHAAVLRDLTYADFVLVNESIHGAGENCGVCGRPPSQERRNDRDHDHENGLPRGLACGGDFGCNRMMPRKLTAERAREVARLLADDPAAAFGLAPYLPRDLTSARAEQIAAYLGRYEAWHAGRAAVSACGTINARGALRCDDCGGSLQ